MESNIFDYKEDDIIVHEGQDATCMYYILSGSVALFLNYQKEDEIILGVCSKESVFCEMGILNNSSSLYTAVAYGDDTRLLKITQDNFVEFIKKYPENTIKILNNMAKINSMLTKNLELLSEEIADNAQKEKRNKQLRANIARYAVRGIDAYRGTQLDIKP